MQEWSAGEPGSAGLESSAWGNGVRPREGEEREKQRRRKEEGGDGGVRSREDDR